MSPFAIIFDIDGVLINSQAATVYSQQFMGKKYGFTLDEITSCSQPGRSLRDFYVSLQKIRPFEADFEVFANTLLAANFSYLEKHTHGLDDNLAALLDDLKKHDVPIAVGTSALKRSAMRKLKLAGVDDRFKVIITADDVERHKPFPDIYLEAAKRLGIAPEHCVVIEDAPAGIQAAKRAGMKAIGFVKYVENKAALAEADLIVSDFSMLDFLTVKKFMAR